METIEIIYLVCAAVGGTLLVCQFALGLLGLGEHHDFEVGGHDVAGIGHDAGAGHDHHTSHARDSSWFVGLLSVRTIVAAVTFFGLGGLAASAHWGGAEPITFAVALAAGIAALLSVAALMRGMYQLSSDGTVRIARAIGKSGTVYVTVPGHKAGSGKVTLTLQNRTVEYQAITDHDELPTGAKIVVVSVVSRDTVEVVPATAVDRSTHV